MSAHDSRRVRSCQRVMVTVVVVVEGRGVAEDPMREVTYFYEKDGTLIARRDPEESRV